ncbi:MAG: M48 family metallopeptidase [bacterium]
MQKTILLNGKKFQYTFKKSRRARRLSITINNSGCLFASVPWKCNEKSAEDFMLKKSSWIINTIEKVKNNAVPLEKIQPIKNLKDCKPEVELFLIERLSYYNKFYSFPYNKIRVKKLARNWGSCSIRKILNFNYLIFFLPSDLADYIVVHELCHLKEMNHSRRFWDLVAKTVPDHKERRKKLRQIVY